MADLKIEFDQFGNPVEPLIVLGRRNGKKINGIKYTELVLDDKMNDVPEFTCKVYKSLSGEINPLWSQITNFRTAWVKNWDTWFDISVDKDHSTEIVKNITAQRLGESELSSINVYGLEVNTETDINRDDYKPTCLYDPENKATSLLDRILSFAPHYHVGHVDESLRAIQRMFSYDDKSVLDCLKDVATEYDCLITAPSHSNKDGTINREICVYDLEPHCECGYRGVSLKDKCPECGSTNILPPYGENTGIFITPDDLGESSSLTANTDSVKNCFKMESGDEVMDAAIIYCMPSGSKYYWYFSDEVRKDMSDGLRTGIEKYEKLQEEYLTAHKYTIDQKYVDFYNQVVDAYKDTGDVSDTKITSTIENYPKLAELRYDILDMYDFFEYELMPTYKLNDTNATEQANIVKNNLGAISVTNLSVASTLVVNNAVKTRLKVLLDTRYTATIKSSSYNNSNHVWSGSIEIVNDSEKEDKATVSGLSVNVNADYENYARQQIEATLKKSDNENYSVSGIYSKSESEFAEEMKKYGLSMLEIFESAGQAVVDILAQLNVTDNNGYAQTNMRTNLYLPYYRKLQSVQKQIKEVQSKMEVLIKYDDSGENLVDCFLKQVDDYISDTHKKTNIETCIGSENLNELYSFRRDETYQNDNYISDGFTNGDLFVNATEFISKVKEEIYKSANYQNSISVSINNIFSNKKFKPLLSYFVVGNWMRVLVDDEIFKLRMIEFTIDYSSNDIQVDFSDVVKTLSGLSDSSSIMASAASMSKSYNSVKRQASQGKVANNILNSVSGGVNL